MSSGKPTPSSNIPVIHDFFGSLPNKRNTNSLIDDNFEQVLALDGYEKKGPKLPKLPTIPAGPAIPPVALDDKCTMELMDGNPTEVRAQDLERIKELGRGAYGVVETMKHVETGTIMAVKVGSGVSFDGLRIHVTVDSEEQKRMLVELRALMKSGSCPYMVRFFGAMFREGDVWICMEVMDTSLDKFCRMCKDRRRPIPEPMLGKTALAVTSALHYMRSELDLMHRDVKPSNILADKRGNIKICDFGISGHLTNSVAKTMNAGCKPYMAPERINPKMKAYDVRSDVWSLGITILELAQGVHPYAKWATPFEQLKQVVLEPSPTLPQDRHFSTQFHDFLQKCLIKEHRQRPRYPELLEHPWLRIHDVHRNNNKGDTDDGEMNTGHERATAASYDVGAFISQVMSGDDAETMKHSLLSPSGEAQENGNSGASASCP